MPSYDFDAILPQVATHAVHGITTTELTRARREFLHLGHTRLSFAAPDIVKDAVAVETLELVRQDGVRRDLRFTETGNTARRMRNVRNKEIADKATVIPGIYAAQPMLDVLSIVAGEDVLPCPYEPERYLITSLEKTGDTHGWHWDDYTFALIWVVECPPVEDGGFVQCVPGTTWDKENPRINHALVSHPTYSMELHPGDLYFIQASTTLHRVYPIRRGRRTIVNMGYASDADLTRQFTHETERLVH